MSAFLNGVKYEKVTDENLASPSLESLENVDIDDIVEENDINDNFPSKVNAFCPQNAKYGRVIKKAKRQLQRSLSESNEKSTVSQPAVNTAVVESSRKNSRKSRSGKGRGLPKKGGAGGKGVWGMPGVELYEDGVCRDSHDPNYDSESEEEYSLVRTEPEVSGDDLNKALEPLLTEYFNHGDTHEVQESLDELNLGKQKARITEKAVSFALDRKAPQREMTSVLISDLYGNVLRSSDIAKGFDNVLSSLSDLTLDAPDAPTVVGQFIARAVADDCLPPRFLQNYKGKVDCPHTRVALDKADILLGMKHGIVRLDNVWGTGGGIRPVKYLIKQINLLLKEYISSGDMTEATRCLRELEVPHFHHEVVYESVVLVLEDCSERTADKICKWLKSLYDSAIVTVEQLSVGFKRVYEDMPDISLDVPAAYMLLERFATKLHKEKVLSSDLFKELPQRGRKRFVSEGDGGRLKNGSS